ncbi:MAG: ankyrin repeat domain-containing protein, partial [Bacillota bacterium]
MKNNCLQKRMTGNIGETKLMIVIKEEADWEVIKKFIREEDVNARNRSGFTALMFAALCNSDHRIIRELIKAGAKVNVRSS